MTKEEKEFCNRCRNHSDCGYVNRGREDDCTVLDVFSQGYQAAIDKSCEYIKEYAPIDYDCDGFVEDFRKAMED